MSAAVPPAPAAVPLVPQVQRRELTIVGHSTLFYWWPVWAGGFLMALLTLFDNDRMVTVNKDAVLAEATDVTIVKEWDDKGKPKATENLKDRDVVVLPDKHGFNRETYPELSKGSMHPRLHISHRRGYGVAFAVILCLVTIITNIPLRGMWSVLVIVGTITLVLILNLAGWWGDIVRSASYLDIRINVGGYLFIAVVLFIAWLVTMLLFDRQIYLTFTPGQLKVCTEIGGGEKVYDSAGMSVEKQRGDIFRHRILGLGSGDLIVKTSGAQAHQFELDNVLFINRKVKMIEDLLKTKQVTE